MRPERALQNRKSSALPKSSRSVSLGTGAGLCFANLAPPLKKTFLVLFRTDQYLLVLFGYFLVLMDNVGSVRYVWELMGILVL